MMVTCFACHVIHSAVTAKAVHNDGKIAQETNDTACTSPSLAERSANQIRSKCHLGLSNFISAVSSTVPISRDSDKTQPLTRLFQTMKTQRWPPQRLTNRKLPASAK